MRTHIVRPNETPVDIAIAYTGCPKCARSLILVNPHKERIEYPNGFITFREMYVNEPLNLPSSWFDGSNAKLDKSDWPWPPGWDENWQKHYRHP